MLRGGAKFVNDSNNTLDPGPSDTGLNNSEKNNVIPGSVPESIPADPKQNNVIASEAKQSMRLTSSKDCFVADAPRNDGIEENNPISLETLTHIAEAEGLTPGLTVALPLDISLADASGAAAQPSGEVAVTIDVPRGMDASGASVYYLADDETFEKMPGRLSDDSRAYTFQTTHFSKYVVLGPDDYTSATTLYASDKHHTLERHNVYTITANTTITGDANNNGLKVAANADASNPAVLYIPNGLTLTVRGGNATGANGGKAAILLPSGSYLYVRGAGQLVVYGGKGSVAGTSYANGGNGTYANTGTNQYNSTYVLTGGAGGASSSGGGGGGAGVGTDGAHGGAGVAEQADGGSLKGKGRITRSWTISGVEFGSSGMNGQAGGAGANSAVAGELSVLDNARFSGAGGAGGSSNAGNAGEYADTSIPFTQAGGGGGGGAPGGGGSGAFVGSGGAGGGAGGSGGGAGSLIVGMGFTISGGYLVVSGGGGAGGKGAPDGADGGGVQNSYKYFHSSRISASGGYGGAGGAAGHSGTGGTVNVATTATVPTLTAAGDINGKPANRVGKDTDKNSLYTIKFDGNRPGSASSSPTGVPGEIKVTAGVPYTSTLTASLTGWSFMGFYTADGVQIINNQGSFVYSAGGGTYTTQNGSWCLPDDATLYAQWEPRVFAVTLNKAGATGSAGTAAIYEKYDTGWYGDAAATPPPLGQIALPTWPNYDFGGYYTGQNGSGTQYLPANGSLAGLSNHAFAANTTLYAKWTPTPWRVEVKVLLDGKAYAGRAVTLRQGGAARYTLSYYTAGGYYYYQTNHPGYTDHGVIAGTYDVYVDGAATGRTIVVNGAPNTSTTLNFYTATVTTKVNNINTSVGAVTLRGASATIPLTWNPAQEKMNYTAPVYLDEATGAANKWNVYINGEPTGFELDMSVEGRRSATVPYYDATFDLTYDSALTDAAVTLRQGGAVRYYLPYVSDEPDGGNYKATYMLTLRGDTNVGGDLYQVFVNGVDTGETLTLTESGTWEAGAEYYEVVVDVSLDGSAWPNTGVTLWRAGGQSAAYTLSYSGGVYSHPFVQKLADDEYDVRVSGSVSGPGTGEKVSEGDPDAEAEYFTVTYKNKGDTYLTQIVRKEMTAIKPAPPYRPGYTFVEWRTDGDEGAPYVFSTPVTDVTGGFWLYAGFDSPSLIIGGYVKCTSGGAIDGDGTYYRMPNLTIQGYPRAGEPISMATLIVTNGAVTFTTTAGFTTHDNLSTGGTGKVTILFEKDGDSSVSVADAQRFLRENVIVTVHNKPTEHRLKASVFGATN